MRHKANVNFQDRLKDSAKAREDLLAKLRAAPGPDDPAVIARRRERRAIAEARVARQAERERVRKVQEEEAARLAAEAERIAAEEAARVAAEEAELEAALKAEQKAARDARYAARKLAKKERRKGIGHTWLSFLLFIRTTNRLGSRTNANRARQVCGHAASSLRSPLATIFIRSAGNGRCSSSASSTGAVMPTSSRSNGRGVPRLYFQSRHTGCG